MTVKHAYSNKSSYVVENDYLETLYKHILSSTKCLFTRLSNLCNLLHVITIVKYVNSVSNKWLHN